MNRFNDFINKIKTNFAITSTELYAVVLLSAGAIIGFVVDPNSQNKDLLIAAIEQVDDNAINQNNNNEVESKNKKEPDSLNNQSINPELSGDTTEETDQFNLNINTSTRSYSKKLSLSDNIKINLNTATKSELMKLPGIGEKTAETIINYRNERKFNKIEDIMKVKGIGQKKFDKMKDFIQIK